MNAKQERWHQRFQLHTLPGVSIGCPSPPQPVTPTVFPPPRALSLTYSIPLFCIQLLHFGMSLAVMLAVRLHDG